MRVRDLRKVSRDDEASVVLQEQKSIFQIFNVFFYRPATINSLQLFHWLLSTEFDNWLQLGFSGQIK